MEHRNWNNWGRRNPRRGMDHRKTGHVDAGESGNRGGAGDRPSSDSGEHGIGGGGDGGVANFYGKHVVYHNGQGVATNDLVPGRKGILALLNVSKTSSRAHGIEEICRVIDENVLMKESQTVLINNQTTTEQFDKTGDKENIECIPSIPLTVGNDTNNVANQKGLEPNKNEQDPLTTNNPWDSIPKTPEGLEDSSKNQEVKKDDTSESANAFEDRGCVFDNYPQYSYVCIPTSVPSAVFVDSKMVNPTHLVEKIFEDNISKEEVKLKHLHRFIPVDLTVTANCEDIVANVREVLLEYLAEKGYISFNIEVQTHTSSTYNTKRKRYTTTYARFNRRDETKIVELLENTVTIINPSAYISLYQPSYLISVQVIGSVAFLSVLTNFGKYNQYML